MYVKSDTLLLADVFENFRKICIKIYRLDPVKFLSAPGLAWQTALKKTEVKLELLTDIHCVKSVHVWSYSGPYFPAFGLNTERMEYLFVFSSNAGKYGPE